MENLSPMTADSKIPTMIPCTKHGLSAWRYVMPSNSHAAEISPLG